MYWEMLDNLINWKPIIASLWFHMQNIYTPAHYIEQITHTLLNNTSKKNKHKMFEWHLELEE